MKRIFLATLAIFLLCKTNAQETTSDGSAQNFNEIKLNGLYMVLGAIDIAYERTINEESAFGASVFVPFDDDDIDYDINFYVSPYYRMYFGKKYAAGFFVEGFGLLSSYDKVSFSSGLNPTVSEDNALAFALGIGVGGKWVTKSGFIGELGLGIGRNIINDDDFNDELVGKINISVGYRF